MLASGKFDKAHLVFSHGIPVSDHCDCIPIEYSPATPPAVPAMADSVLLLRVFLSCPAVNLSSLTEVIRNDVGLTIELLRLVSCESTVDGEFSIAKSVVHAGVHKLSRLGSNIKLLSSCGRNKASLRKCERFWSHARLTALMAEEHAYQIGCNPEEAYITGLLFRIGELPLLLGWDCHVTVRPSDMAGTLARTWGLPDRLAEILEGDALQLPSSSRTLLQLARVADQQACRVQALVSGYARRAL
jgi:HD-like signal output (HDOD) protein